MERITPRGFQEHIRHSLFNSDHNFNTDTLNHAENAFNSFLVSSGHKELKKGHLDDALEHIQGNHDFKKLAPHQQEAFVSTLRKTFDPKGESTSE